MKVTFIGAGAIASAIALGANATNPHKWKFVFCDTNPSAAHALAKRVEGQSTDNSELAVIDADLIVLAVKPGEQTSVLKKMGQTTAPIVSVAAGRTINQIGGDLQGTPNVHASLIRVMPNINANVGLSTTAICFNKLTTKKQIETVKHLFDTIGTTIEIPENLFSVFTAMSGSSPAWFFAIIEHMARAAVNHGLTNKQATTIAIESMAGSAKTLIDTIEHGGTPSTLIDKVCSPNGTTIAGLLAAEQMGLGTAITSAVDATIKRAKEMSTKT